MEGVRDVIETVLHPDHNMPGCDPKNPRKWLNDLRLTMLERLSVNMVTGVEVNHNDSVMTYGDLVSRLSGFIVADDVSELNLDVTAPSDRPLEVYTDMFTPKDAIIKDIHLTTLPPGKRLQLKAYARGCSFEKDGRAVCTPVVAVGFYEPETPPGSYVFFYEPKMGVIDPEQIYHKAVKLMGTPREEVKAASSRAPPAIELPQEHLDDEDLGLNEAAFAELDDILDF